MPIFSPMLRLLVVSCLFFVALSGAHRANAQSGLDLKSIETFAYDSMLNWTERSTRPHDAMEVAAVEGHVFFDIRAIFDVPWTDELSRLSVSARDITLTLPDGTDILNFGRYEYWGMMTATSAGVSMSRPRNHPDEDADLYWHALFIVPQGVTTATLTIPGEPGWQGEVTIPATGPEQVAADFATFQVLAADRLRMVALEDGRDTQRLLSTITAPKGSILADLNLAVTPSASNDTGDSDRFFFRTYDFRLVGDSGENFWPLGERFMDRVLDWQFNGVTVGDTATRRMLWIVPEDVTRATLYFGLTPVAEVDLTAAVR